MSGHGGVGLAPQPSLGGVHTAALAAGRVSSSGLPTSPHLSSRQSDMYISELLSYSLDRLRKVGAGWQPAPGTASGAVGCWGCCWARGGAGRGRLQCASHAAAGVPRLPPPPPPLPPPPAPAGARAAGR